MLIVRAMLGIPRLKTKFNADNLKGKGKTDLAGEDHKLYHVTLIGNILEENDSSDTW
jgi:hypothetical protein